MRLPEHRKSQWRMGWEVERIAALYKELSYHTVAPTLLDIGSEEGDITALFGVWGYGVIIAEPSPKFWGSIKTTWESNNIKRPLGYFKGFVCNTTNSKIKPWHTLNDSEIIPEPGFKNLWEDDPEIPRIKIDDILQTPQVINIDVEGSEFEVLKGAEKTLRNSRPVVFASVHPEFMFHNHQQYSTEMFSYMSGLKYKYELLAIDHEYHFKFYPSPK